MYNTCELISCIVYYVHTQNGGQISENRSYVLAGVTTKYSECEQILTSKYLKKIQYLL